MADTLSDRCFIAGSLTSLLFILMAVVIMVIPGGTSAALLGQIITAVSGVLSALIWIIYVISRKFESRTI